jgi:hypothetical protein
MCVHAVLVVVDEARNWSLKAIDLVSGSCMTDKKPLHCPNDVARHGCVVSRDRRSRQERHNTDTDSDRVRRSPV